MAVIKNLHVSVHADGEPLQERQDVLPPEHDEGRPTLYIESKSGQTFAIHMATPAEEHFQGGVLSYDVYVDGRLVDTVLIQKGSPVELVEVSEGLQLPNGHIRHFRFADLTIEEYGPASKIASEDHNKNKDVGKVSVVVHHKNLGDASNLYVDPRGWKDVSYMDEKMIKGKAVSHSVSLAPPVEAGANAAYYKTLFVNPERVPFAVFTFLYRSADKLAAIFPATPTPNPEPETALENLDANTMSPDQVRELQQRVMEADRRLKESQPTATLIRGIKREHAENEAEDGPLRRQRRKKSAAYLALGDDNEFQEVEPPVRPSQPSTQVD